MTLEEYTGVPDTVPRGPWSQLWEQRHGDDEIRQLILDSANGDEEARNKFDNYRELREFDMSNANLLAADITRAQRIQKVLDEIVPGLGEEYGGQLSPIELSRSAVRALREFHENSVPIVGGYTGSDVNDIYAIARRITESGELRMTPDEVGGRDRERLVIGGVDWGTARYLNDGTIVFSHDPSPFTESPDEVDPNVFFDPGPYIPDGEVNFVNPVPEPANEAKPGSASEMTPRASPPTKVALPSSAVGSVRSDQGSALAQEQQPAVPGSATGQAVGSEDVSWQPSPSNGQSGTAAQLMEPSSQDVADLLTVPGAAMSAGQREALMQMPAFSDEGDPLFGPAVWKYRDANTAGAARAVETGAVDGFGRPLKPVFAETDGAPADADGAPMAKTLGRVGQAVDKAVATVGPVPAVKALQGAVNDLSDAQVKADTPRDGLQARPRIPKLAVDGDLGPKTREALRLALHQAGPARLEERLGVRLG